MEVAAHREIVFKPDSVCKNFIHSLTARNLNASRILTCDGEKICAYYCCVNRQPAICKIVDGENVNIEANINAGRKLLVHVSAECSRAIFRNLIGADIFRIAEYVTKIAFISREAITITANASGVSALTHHIFAAFIITGKKQGAYQRKYD